MRISEPKPLSEKLKQLIRLNRFLKHIQSKIDTIQTDLAINIIDGLSTGSQFMDFVLVANGGVYDERVLCIEYERLINAPLTQVGSTILFLQTSKSTVRGQVVTIRNIFLAKLRHDYVSFDSQKLTMEIPVADHYFVFREVIKGTKIISGSIVKQDNVLEIGPLANKYCSVSLSKTDAEGHLYTSIETPCYYEILPCDDLYEDYGISGDFLRKLEKAWKRIIWSSNTPN